MATHNTLFLIGNLGSAAEAYTDKNGKPFYRLSLATTDTYQDENGTWQQHEPVWHTLFAFAPGVQKHAAFYAKGQRVKVTATVRYKIIEAFAADGSARSFSEALLIAQRIEAAPLPKKAKA